MQNADEDSDGKC